MGEPTMGRCAGGVPVTPSACDLNGDLGPDDCVRITPTIETCLAADEDCDGLSFDVDTTSPAFERLGWAEQNLSVRTASLPPPEYCAGPNEWDPEAVHRLEATWVSRPVTTFATARRPRHAA
jgi:hypothetical protein